MKTFQCGNCNNAIFFENYTCDNCGHLSGYRDTDRTMLTFDPNQEELISDREHTAFKYCKNKAYNVCNWILEKDSPEDYCTACQLNRTIPDLTDRDNFSNWCNLEIAKHRLIYQLQKVGLTLVNKQRDEAGFSFDFVSKKNNPSIMTGHANGIITILLQEADSVVREKMRKQFLEPYRTLIGHLRHEVGHYFWDRLVYKNPSVLQEFRALFGNEEQDYSEALKSYYKNGAPDKWQTSFITKYATAHPWEDWAETWAHYLHVMDMVETSYFFGIKVQPKEVLGQMATDVSFDPYTITDFQAVINTCIPLSFAVNSINRAMGVPDVYPFVITPNVVEKMKFIHHLLLPKR